MKAMVQRDRGRLVVGHLFTARRLNNLDFGERIRVARLHAALSLSDAVAGRRTTTFFVSRFSVDFAENYRHCVDDDGVCVDDA